MSILESRRFVCAAALLLAIVATAPAARAQSPSGLHTHFRLVNSMSGGSNSGDYRVGDGWVTGGPLVTHGANTVTNALGMSSSSDFTAIADYYHLRFYGSGSATSAPGNGCFLMVDSWIGGTARAEFVDRIWVASATLPPGTPAIIQFQLSLTGGTTVVDPYPIVSYRAELTANDLQSPPSLQLVQNGAAGIVSGSLNTMVGDSINVHGALFLDIAADGVRIAMSPASTIAADLRAQTSIAVMTPGVSISSASHTVDVPTDRPVLALSLDGAQPNPAPAGQVAIHFVLPSSEPATLALFDVSGRRLASTDVGSLGAGPHVVDLAQGRPVAPGVYLVRLIQGAAVRTARVAALR